MFTARYAAAVFVLTGVAFAQTAKRPLHHRDYDGWNSIQTQVLSRDGKFLAYALFPEDGDGQLVVRNIATGKEVRENAGSPPPAQDNTDTEAGAGQQGAVRTIRITFTHDNRFVVASAFPAKADTDKARKDKKPAAEMPKNSMLIVDLSAMSVSRVADVASFQVPENGESFVAYLKGPKATRRRLRLPKEMRMARSLTVAPPTSSGVIQIRGAVDVADRRAAAAAAVVGMNMARI